MPRHRILKNGDVPITTAIPRLTFEEIKKNHWKYCEVMRAGVQALKGMPNVLGRIEELESGNDRLQKKLTEFSWKLSRYENRSVQAVRAGDKSTTN